MPVGSVTSPTLSRLSLTKPSHLARYAFEDLTRAGRRRCAATHHSFSSSPVILAGDSAIGSPYFQSISRGFEPGRSGLDEDHERLGQDPVVSHRLGSRLALHRAHDGVHLRN